MTRSTARKSAAKKTAKTTDVGRRTEPGRVLSRQESRALEASVANVADTMAKVVRPVLVQGISVPVIPFRTEVLIEATGSVTAAAELLGVAKSQPTRWRKGQAVPSPEKARLLTDLEHVFSRASMIFEPPVIKDWMTGSNDYLEGARPIDVLKTRGVSEVLDALDAAEQIAFGG